MGIPVICYGKSGSGKSRSLKNFAEDEIALINVEGKQLPFKKKFKYEFKTDDVETIVKSLKKMPTKTAIIDDAGYIMTHRFMKNHRNMKGNAQFDMYNAIADDMYTLIQSIKELPDDAIVYVILHEDTTDYGSTGLKTLGKLLDSKVCMEGMVTICIRCMSEEGRHFFRVVTDGSDITKTPEDLFDAEEIENDLKYVDSKIREFYF